MNSACRTAGQTRRRRSSPVWCRWPSAPRAGAFPRAMPTPRAPASKPRFMFSPWSPSPIIWSSAVSSSACAAIVSATACDQLGKIDPGHGVHHPAVLSARRRRNRNGAFRRDSHAVALLETACRGRSASPACGCRPSDAGGSGRPDARPNRPSRPAWPLADLRIVGCSVRAPIVFVPRARPVSGSRSARQQVDRRLAEPRRDMQVRQFPCRFPWACRPAPAARPGAGCRAIGAVVIASIWSCVTWRHGREPARPGCASARAAGSPRSFGVERGKRLVHQVDRRLAPPARGRSPTRCISPPESLVDLFSSSL